MIPAHPVILLHGLGRSSASMWWLAWLLRNAGFRTHLLDYPSNRQSLSDNLDTVREQVLRIGDGNTVDLIGHSMGGVIARRLCLEPGDPNIRRVVQIGAPNQGSALADRMGPIWAVRRACGPSIHDLRATTQILPCDPRIHAIAGTGGCNTGNGVLRGPHDGAVTVRSAWAGAGTRYLTSAMHTLMPLSNQVGRYVLDALIHE